MVPILLSLAFRRSFLEVSHLLLLLASVTSSYIVASKAISKLTIIICCGFWGIWTLFITEGLGDLIALKWSLTRNRVSGRWQTLGQEEA